MIIERQDNGSLLISDTVGNDWIKKVYYFYSKKEAIKLFREYRREVKKKKSHKEGRYSNDRQTKKLVDKLVSRNFCLKQQQLLDNGYIFRQVKLTKEGKRT
jgi:hypothetical protein